MAASNPAPFIASDYEKMSRVIRWFAIAAVVVLLPTNLGDPRIWWFGILIVVAILFNLSRYVPRLLRLPFYGTPANNLASDGIFIAALLILVGSISTPYTAYFAFLLISAAYELGMRGALAVAIPAVVFLFVISMWPLFSDIHLGLFQTVIVYGFILITLGLQTERLTRNNRQQRDDLLKATRDDESERLRLIALLNSVNDAVFVVDADKKIIQHNDMAANLAEKREGIDGELFRAIFPLHPRDDPAAKPVDIFTSQAGAGHRRDLVLSSSKTDGYDLDIRVIPVAPEKNQETTYLVIATNITKERTLDEQRKEFISVASHELRTPITIMEAALSTALSARDQYPEQIAKFLTQAHDKSLYLGEIIKDLGTISQAETGNLPVEPERVYPRRLLDDLADGFQSQAEQSGLALKVEIKDDTPSIMTTKRHVEEILQNYIVNALKYSQQGTIRLEAAPGSSGSVIFSVADTGIGISPGEQKSLFVKFFRAEDYRTRQTGGTGLGLYLCRQLADRLDGNVWAKSKLNQGSTFYLEIPPQSGIKGDRREVTQAQVSSLFSDL
jgi:signal transduction histidine kinase